MKECVYCGAGIEQKNWQCHLCGGQPEKINDILFFAPNFDQENQGFNPELFITLAQLEERNFWFCSRNQLIVWTLKKYFPRVKNFLEIGCGTGFVISGLRKAFPTLLITGSEVHGEGLKYAINRVSDGFFLQMDARCIPYQSEFDVIGAFDVLEHIVEDEMILEQMHKAVRKGGGIILTVPQHRFLWSVQDDYASHVRRYERDDLVEKVVGAGFKVIYVTSFVFLLLPLMFISRLRQRGDAVSEPLEELKLGRLTNWVFGLIMSVERFLIYVGVRFPVGGSLLVVAKKK